MIVRDEEKILKVLKEIKKIAMIKTVKIIIIVDIAYYCILIFLWVGPISYSMHDKPLNIEAYVANIVLMLFLTILFDWLIYIFLFTTYQEIALYKISEIYVDKILSKDNYVEVLPNEIPERYYTFIMAELPQLADFFAILTDTGDGVNIFLKFKNHDSYVFLEYVEKKYFPSTYIIKNACDDIELEFDEVKKLLSNNLSCKHFL